jgi:pimeloyl-ACP methyl ester carboxylesterase
MAGPNPFHPFKSAEARDEYLALYERRAARWPIPSETRMVDTTFGQTFVRISGREEAPPLVLLPGMTSNGLMWQGVIEPLSAERRTYAVDNVYDVGRSIWSRHLRKPADFTAWLDELCTNLGHAEVDLMGVSFGGWIAAHMALARPERVRRTVWVEPAGIVQRLSSVWMVRALACGIHPKLHQSFTNWMFADAVKTPEGQRVADELTADTAVAMRCFVPRKMVMPTRMSDDELRAIRVPSLVLMGEHETIYSAPKALARLRAVAPQIEAELVPDAGHDLPIVQAEAMVTKALAFVGR